MTRSAREGLCEIGKSERGFTLVELLITMLLLVIVLGATLAVLDKTNLVAAKDQERTVAVGEVQAGIAQMDHDLRLAGTGQRGSASSTTTSINGVNGGNYWQIDITVRCRTGDTRCVTPSGEGPQLREIYRCDAAFGGTSNNPSAQTAYRSCVKTTSNTVCSATDASTQCVANECCTQPWPGIGTSSDTATLPPGGTTAGPNCSSAPAGTPCSVVVDRLLNWDNNTYPNDRVFLYHDSNSTALPSTIKVEQIDITIRVPRAGERRYGQGATCSTPPCASDLLFKDAVYLRNIDMY
jgi:prepilin-type N-terminal cleavage/methylation domain-containing protein